MEEKNIKLHNLIKELNTSLKKMIYNIIQKKIALSPKEKKIFLEKEIIITEKILLNQNSFLNARFQGKRFLKVLTDPLFYRVPW